MIRVLTIALILLVPSAYYICELFFSDDLTNWWYLRACLYSLEVAMAFYILHKTVTEKVSQVICYIGVWVCTQDAADKLGRIYSYTWWDVPVIILAIYLAYKKYVHKNHTRLHS